MNNSCLHGSLEFCVNQIRQGAVIAYPTEAVFGLGCDPDNEAAVMALLSLKQRPVHKGLILIAANYRQLQHYLDDTQLSKQQKDRMFASWPGPVTWVIPARETTPRWLTGQFNSLAVRVSNHSEVRRLCLAVNKPLVSTSANITTLPPCRTPVEVCQQFGVNFPVLLAETGGRKNPSEIRDALTGELIRQG
ncbi:L-threonylcarbamoyladenylate synthase type 1 TsaC [Erwinia tracheiphila]|uniref:Threonylcarbamoyl-AMP synthase n=1 Tax=Erwinia tracheiphila TaxID=65700 RepID=A0A0M2KJR4_9GAMM|nr:L-threonylcarbamoyladenylate synthase type 1 TsaC [Erwinia tracheiphila]AXF78107.1 L-threonylcarbamoyladenylate synthase type 1 TsaC [Erwinia tracheiphila]EOS95514.1 tRNA(ANN) t(6)A37 threonylcarbamoyladenosine modification protein [Erwinia tracheiphila PSU-1]KKF37256.1 tRNA(ANN) t(6)A37 threonylcarbamoyladenosine modification protein [Erwinia tracheiphila]UIA83179.1 L-threonylcarbamoyladenylate synthase type 1 TsaC [Erwinia tracheiphila]UIA88650.1 L-threonylcarbamoyladenylate synthase type